MKYEHKIQNLYPHTPTVGIFNIVSMVEEMFLALTFLFSHIHPNLS